MMEFPDTPAPDGSRSTDRRTLLRRAAAAGAIAWTAPVILESVTSPAGALTLPAGCSRMWVPFTAEGAGWPAWQASAPATVCTPSGTCSPIVNSTAPAVAVSISPLTQPNDVSTTAVTISVGEGCSIVGASAMVKNFFELNQSCRTATASGVVGNTTFTFGAGGTAVTIKPNGGSPLSDFWDQETILHPRSNIGIVVSCP